VSAAPEVSADEPSAARVRRTGPREIATAAGFVVVVAILAQLPFFVTAAATGPLVTFFVLLTMSTAWNLLAGYAGLVSIGQQAYVGLGAYALVQLSDWGVHPFLGVALAAVAAALFALPTSWLAFRLRGDYFAVGTWVIADLYRLVVVRDDALGGGSGRSLTTLAGFDPVLRQAITYWIALGVAALSLASGHVLLRSRLGLSLMAIRDDEIAARSLGVHVVRAKRAVYLVSAAGAGAAGGVLVVSQLSVHPDAIFSVQWSAYMIFIVLIGGLGSLEGPVLGAVVFFAMQQTMAAYGAFYLVVLGAVAVAVAALWPRGLFGWAAERFGFRPLSAGRGVTFLASAAREEASPLPRPPS
jgi:branched-chain amino acid transport system permease protein